MNKKQILVPLILLLGIIISVFLVQRQQNIKSRASGEEIYQQITVSDSNCSGEGNIYNCQTDSEEVEIDISNLLNQLN